MAGGEQFSMAKTFLTLSEVTAEALDDLREDEVRRLQEQGTVVRLGAWSSAGGRMTPVHLEGFDDLAPGEFVEYERVVVALNDEQRAQWETIVAKAKAINESGEDLDFGDMAENLADHLDDVLGGPLEALDEAVDGARTTAETQGDAVVEQVRASLARIQAKADLLELLVRQKVAKYEQLGDVPSALFLLADLRDDAHELRDDGRELLEVVEQEQAAIMAAIGSSAAALGEAAGEVGARLEALAEVYRSLTATSSLNLVALQFGEEVLAIDIADVPAGTQLDLRYTGPRKPGDQVAFVMRGGPADEDPSSHAELDSRQFSMFRILGNVSPSVSLAFANPSGATALQTDFQAAPTYNLLYRWGDRDSAFFNRFLTPGVGLAFSALDFDGDDNLELGVGATAAVFQDWVQVGYGYNVGTDDEYWFFGFSLPLLNAASGGAQ